MATISGRSLRERYTSRAFCMPLLLALGSTHCSDGALILVQQAEPVALEPSAGPDGDPTLPGAPTRPEADPGVTQGNGSDPNSSEGNPAAPLDGDTAPDGNGGPGKPSFGSCQPRAS